MTKQSKDETTTAAKGHKKQSDIVVVSVGSASPRQRKLLMGSFAVLFVASALTAGIVTYNRDGKPANAGGAATLGRSGPADDELGIKTTPLEPMPANKFFSLQLALGTNTATLIWDLNQQQSTATSPFPRNGIYRITSTTDQANANSWKPVNNAKLGTGVELRFESAKGDNLAQWTPVDYDNGASTENILPASAQLGQTYYFRLELKEPNGTWKQIDNSTLKLRIPYPEIKLVALPRYTTNVSWTGNSSDSSFDTTNPKINIFWYGNGLDETAAYTYLYVSDSPDMLSRQKATTRNIYTNETFDAEASTADASTYFVAQQPGTQKYYAVYSQAGQRLSAVLTLTTQSK